MDKDQRIQELLESNNKYLQRARDAEHRESILEARVRVLDEQLSGAECELGETIALLQEEICKSRKPSIWSRVSRLWERMQ